jgi:cytochrome c oxidase assembly factor CtaG
MPSYLFLAPVQNYVNSVTRRRNASAEYYGWPAGHILCWVLGLVVWALTLYTIGVELQS